MDYADAKQLAEWADKMAVSHQPDGIPCGASELVYRAVAIKLRELEHQRLNYLPADHVLAVQDNAIGFTRRELRRIEAALAAEPMGTDRWRQLFAAQQALSWAAEPSGFASPLDSIDGNTGRAVNSPPS